MGSSGGGMPLISGHAGTPESITLSVDSLPQQRQMYSQGKGKKKTRSNRIDGKIENDEIRFTLLF